MESMESIESRPIPDPTTLTVELTRREIAALRELIETRLRGMDKAIELLQVNTAIAHEPLKLAIKTLDENIDQRIHVIVEKLEGSVGLLKEQISSLSSVTMQQFKSIDDRFAEKDKAVSVGLQAQKESAAAQQASNTEATAKMESNFTKLLDQGRELLGEVRRNTELQINDLKSGLGLISARLDKGEGRVAGTVDVKKDSRDQLATLISLASIGIAFAALIYSKFG
jgi:hypothetical protein